MFHVPGLSKVSDNFVKCTRIIKFVESASIPGTWNSLPNHIIMLFTMA